MDPHGIDILHVADGYAVVPRIAHHLVLKLLPTFEVALDEDLVGGAGCDTAGGDGGKLVPGAGNAATGAAKGVGGAYYEGESELFFYSQGAFYGLDGGAGRGRLADIVEELLEEFTVLGLADGA